MGEEMTGSGQAMGTADYMAPEQASDSRTVDIRADIYSLGCTLYKLLSGRAPFSGPAYRGTLDKMNAHVQETPPPLRQFVSALPEELTKLVERMIAKNPADRPATPAKVVASLEPFCRNNVGQAANVRKSVGQVANLPKDGQDNTSSRQVANLPHNEVDLPALIGHAITLPREQWAKAEKSQDANFITPRPATAPNRRRPIIKNLLLAMGFFGALALAFGAGILIKITKDGKETSIEVPAGSATRIGENGQVEVTMPDTDKPPKPIDPYELVIDRPDMVQGIALNVLEPMTWQWRLNIPKGHRYHVCVANGLIPAKELPKNPWSIMSNEPFWETGIEVVMTAALRRQNDGTWALTINSRAVNTKNQLGSGSKTIPDKDVQPLIDGNIEISYFGNKGTQTVKAGEPIILLKKRALPVSEAFETASQKSLPGIMIWLEDEKQTDVKKPDTAPSKTAEVAGDEIPLSLAIEDFNKRMAANLGMQNVPPLTEEEVISLFNYGGWKQGKEIAEKRRIPRSYEFDIVPDTEDPSKRSLLLWKSWLHEPRNGMYIRHDCMTPFKVPVLDPAAVVLQSLYGSWQVASVEKGNAADWLMFDRLLQKGCRYDFVGNQLAVRSSHRDLWGYGIVVGADSKTIDLYDGTGALFAVGLFERKDERLTLCLAHRPLLDAAPRPKALAAEADSPNVLLTLERYQPSADEEKIEGKWSVVNATQDGRSVSRGPSDGFLEFFDGFANNRFFPAFNATDLRSLTGQYFLHPDREPKGIDFNVCHGIYQFDGNRMTIAFRKNAPAPEKFESTPGSGITLLELKFGGKSQDTRPNPQIISYARLASDVGLQAGPHLFGLIVDSTDDSNIPGKESDPRQLFNPFLRRDGLTAAFLYLRTTLVQNELSLSDAQKERIASLDKEFNDTQREMLDVQNRRSSPSSPAGEGRASFLKKLKDLDRYTQESMQKLQGILELRQWERLTEIAIQYGAFGILSTSEAGNALGYTEAQWDAIKSVADDVSRKLRSSRPTPQRSVRDRDKDQEKKAASIFREAVEKILQILTPSQREIFDKLCGKSIDTGKLAEELDSQLTTNDKSPKKAGPGAATSENQSQPKASVGIDAPFEGSQPKNLLGEKPDKLNPAAELKALQGPWKIVKVEKGKDANTTWAAICMHGFSLDPATTQQFVFGGFGEEDRWEIRRFGPEPSYSSSQYQAYSFLPSWFEQEGHFRIGLSAVPKSLDVFSPSFVEPRRLTGLGIYELTGDRLQICFTKYRPMFGEDEQRPKSFTIDSNTDDILFTLERYQPSQDEQAFMGRWIATSHIVDGKSLAEEAAHQEQCLFYQGSLIIDHVKGTADFLSQGKYFLNEKREPKQITVYTYDKKKWQDLLGIYRINGNKLTIAYRKNGPAPDKFESTPGSGVTLLELKRDKPKPTEGTVPAPEDAKPDSDQTKKPTEKPATPTSNPAAEEPTYDGKPFDEWKQISLTDLNPEARAKSMDAFLAMGRAGQAEAAVAAIQSVLKQEKHEQVVKAAYAALADIGPTAVPLLLEALRSEDVRKRRLVAEEIAPNRRSRPKTEVPEEVVLELIRAVEDKDPTVHAFACRSLGNLSTAAASEKLTSQIISALTKALADEEQPIGASFVTGSAPNPKVRFSASHALQNYGPRAEIAVPALLDIVRTSTETPDRTYAIWALGRIGRSAKPAIPVLEELEQQDRNRQLKSSAYEALTLIRASVAEEEPEGQHPLSALFKKQGVLSALICLKTKLVRKELELTDSQNEKIALLSKDYDDSLSKLSGELTKSRIPMKVIAEMDNANARYMKTLTSILEPHQIDRLSEIMAQYAGLSQLPGTNAGRAFEFSDDQMEKFRSIGKEFTKKMLALTPPQGDSEERKRFEKEKNQKAHAIRKERDKQIWQLMTSKQREMFDKMKGKEIDTDKLAEELDQKENESAVPPILPNPPPEQTAPPASKPEKSK